MYYHRVWADIDLAAASYNLEQLRSLLPDGTGIMIVAKADAYGHGAVHIARHLQHQGIWGFGVGDSKEALELRDAGVTCPILILGAIIEGEVERVVGHGIGVCIHSGERVDLLDREARRQGKRCRVHLMVDTGMGRLGAFPEGALSQARDISAAKGLVLEGVATHFSCTSDPDDPFTDKQVERFMEIKKALDDSGIRPTYFHASNSGAIINRPAEPFNLVRSGIAVYGISAAKKQWESPPLKPVMSLKTQIIYMKDVPADTPIGYDRLHTTPGPTRIATLPIGYNDGYRYNFSCRGRVLVRGKPAPVVGAVSMDYTMVDVGHIEGAAVGDLVTLIGREGEERITVEELACMADTIPYEITCGIGKRVRRVALSGPKDAASRIQTDGAKRQEERGASESGVGIR